MQFPIRENSLSHHESWASFILGLAAIYNLCWGAVVVLFPKESLSWVGLSETANQPLVQCIGMLVGVYGVAYWVSALSPSRYWPLVGVGLLGKILGPIGGVVSVGRGDLPVVFLKVNVINDLVWWIPFGWVLWCVWQGNLGHAVPSRGENRSLYQKLLGPDFFLLGPHLQRFHGSERPLEVQGELTVVRNDGGFRNWLADRAALPSALDAHSVTLKVVQQGSKEIWSRCFGTTNVRTSQWISNGCLTECWGSVTIDFRIKVIGDRLWMESLRSRFLGIPLPPFLSPRVQATAIDTDQGIEIVVCLGVQPFGELVRYFGVVELGGKEPTV